MALLVDVVHLSPNYTVDQNNDPVPMPASTKTVIIHGTRSGKSMNPSEFIGTLNYMSRYGTTSSHLVIGREANQTARVVPDDLRAHHAAEDNDNAWGIEVCQGVESDGFTDAQYEQLRLAGLHYMKEFGVPARHARSSTEPGFIGHEETAQGKRDGKSDPGRLFDWDRFILSLREEPKQEEPPMMTWARLKDRPEGVMFRTYLLWADAGGLKSRFVPNFEEHQALEESGVAGSLREMSIETLRQFKCTPDPLA